VPQVGPGAFRETQGIGMVWIGGPSGLHDLRAPGSEGVDLPPSTRALTSLVRRETVNQAWGQATAFAAGIQDHDHSATRVPFGIARRSS
jgi:hypothetical protein